MLSGVGIAHEFWSEAFDTTCYLVNSSLLMDLVKKTPYEAWTGKNTSFSHLRVFGCDVFVHVSKDNNNNKKLNNKYEKCIFIRCKYGVKRYKLWNAVTRKKICSRCVIFIEFEATSKIKEGKREKEPKYIEFNGTLKVMIQMSRLNSTKMWNNKLRSSRGLVEKRNNLKGIVHNTFTMLFHYLP